MLLYLARHVETVYNAGARMQGHMAHTPLTRAGIAQAEPMGATLATHFGPGADIDIGASPAGRTLQTVAIVAEHLGCDFFDIRTDSRLLEIDVGRWEGRRYADIVAEQGPILCPDARAFNVMPPGGEYHPAIAARLQACLAELNTGRVLLVISHGITLRVRRGLLAGGRTFEGNPRLRRAAGDGVPVRGRHSDGAPRRRGTCRRARGLRAHRKPRWNFDVQPRSLLNEKYGSLPMKINRLIVGWSQTLTFPASTS